MRMRITKTPPRDYGSVSDSLLVGRVYNLDAALASALLLEGCAELYDLLTPEERHERSRLPVRDGWARMSGVRPPWLRRS
jgi:hypothetical protein